MSSRPIVSRLSAAMAMVMLLVLASISVTRVEAKPALQPPPPVCPLGVWDVNQTDPLAFLDTFLGPLPIVADLPDGAATPAMPDLKDLPIYCHGAAVLTGTQEVAATKTSLGGSAVARYATEVGDPDGEGMLLFYQQLKTGQTCYLLSVQDITLPATAAHLHSGEYGKPGDVVLPLKAPNAKGR